MAQYKVPQDVEAEDKLLGPFNARQVIYLFVGLGAIGLIVGLMNISIEIGLILSIPLLLIALFFIILALPLKKDQPTETYLIALINFHFLKPQKRLWNPGQRESTILITAPKKLDGPRVRTIEESEASRRLSFLADIVDTEGYSIKGGASYSPQGTPTTPNPVLPTETISYNTPTGTPLRSEYAAEATKTQDIYSTPSYDRLNTRLSTSSTAAHDDAVAQMRNALNQMNNIAPSTPSEPPKIHQGYLAPPPSASAFTSTISSDPSFEIPSPTIPSPEKLAAMEALSKNTDFSVATIAKEANRIEKKSDDEIYISLH